MVYREYWRIQGLQGYTGCITELYRAYKGIEGIGKYIGVYQVLCISRKRNMKEQPSLICWNHSKEVTGLLP